MTDIDQKAREIAGRHVRVDYDPIGTGIVAEITAALQSARNDALEEAAKAAEDTQQDFVNADSDHAMAYNDACVDIATAIRALKTTTG